jgi:hypothetical protein
VPGPADAIKQLLAQPGGSPEKRAALQARLAQLESAAPAPAMQPSAMGGAMVPEPVPVPDFSDQRRERRILENAKKQAAQHALPTAYRPSGPDTAEPPILFHDGVSEDDEGWKAALGRAQERNVPAYRMSKEFPIEASPAGVGNAVLRGVTGSLAPALLAADNSLTGGLGTKLPVWLGEKAGLLPGGTAAELGETIKANPVESAIGGIAGSIPAGGLAGRVGGGVTRGLEKLAPGAQGFLPSLLRMSAGGAASAGAQTAVESGVDKFVGGARDILADSIRSAAFGGVLGPVFGGLAKLGRSQQAAVRDTDTPMGRDLTLAEQGGAKPHWWSALTPSPAQQAVKQEAQSLGFTTGDVLTERAVDPLGKAVQGKLAGLPAKPTAAVGPDLDEAAVPAGRALGKALEGYRGRTLQQVGDENKELYASAPQVNLEPMARRAWDVIRKATSADGTALPGQKVTEAVNALKGSATFKTVAIDSDAAQSADPEDVIPLSLARKLGLLRGTDAPEAAGPDAAKRVVIMKPRVESFEKLEAARQQLDERAGAVGEYDPARKTAKELAGAAREVRDQLPGDVQAIRARQAEALNGLKNALEAGGVGRDGAVDMGQFGTLDALYKSARRYGSPGNAVADAELNRIAKADPALRAALDRVKAAHAKPADAVEPEVPQDIKNALWATGQPKDARGVNLGDAETRNRLGEAAARYKGHGEVTRSEVLDELATNNAELRKALADAASGNAANRLRGQASMRFAVTPQGQVKPYGASTGVRLRFDPFMGALGSMNARAPGVAGGTAAELARQYKRRTYPQ